MVYVQRPRLLQWPTRLRTVNAVAVPTTTSSIVSTASPMVTTSYVVQPTTVVTPARTVVTATQGTSSPQVTVNQSGQTITLTINGTATTNQTAAASPLVGESVASGDAPYLTSLIDGSGRGTVAGLVKARLRQKIVQSGGLSGINFGGLLQEGLKFLLDEFGSGFSFNLNQAVPDILNIINSLLNEQQGGGNNQQGTNGGGGITSRHNVAATWPGTYQFQGTITINTGGSGGNLTPNPPNNQTGPPNNQTGPTPNSPASDAVDRDPNPSTSPFGSSS